MVPLMARPARHDASALLDSARSVVAGRGVRAATVAALAQASGAPTGSIYHRFASVDEVLARAWLRAARRSQACVVAGRAGDPLGDVVASALAVYDFCLRERDDALLLGTLRRADFAGARLPDELRAELAAVNAPLQAPLRALARGAFGRADARAVDLVLLAVLDLPFGVARRHLEAGTSPPRGHRRRLEAAVRAVMAG
jgi:AcrR family transcriptional regulator